MSKKGKKVVADILKLLENPSMENLFPGVSLPDTTHGEIFFQYKNDIMTVLSKIDIRAYSNAFANIYKCYENSAYILRAMLGVPLKSEFFDNSIQNIICRQQFIDANASAHLQDLSGAIKKILNSPINLPKDIKEYNMGNSIFLIAFFEILKLEIEGQITDQQKILKSKSINLETFEQEFKELFWQTEEKVKYVESENALAVIQENINAITRLVYMKNNPDETEEKNVLEYYREYIKLFSENSKYHTTDLPKYIDFSILLAIIQEGRRMENNEIEDEEYHYYLNKIKSAKRKINSRGKLTTERYYIAFVNHLIFCRALANRGYGRAVKQINDTICLLYDVFLKQLKFSTPLTIEIFHKYIYGDISGGIYGCIRANFQSYVENICEEFFSSQDDRKAQKFLRMESKYISDDAKTNERLSEILKNYINKTKKFYILKKYTPEE